MPSATPVFDVEAYVGHRRRGADPRAHTGGVTGQRILAVLLTALLFAFVVVVAVAIFRAAGHPAWGWVVGIGFCLAMVYGFLRERQRRDRP